jgi:hypothetical protein
MMPNASTGCSQSVTTRPLAPLGRFTFMSMPARCLALVPGSDELLSILKHLSVGRTSVRRFLFRGAAALVFHLATIETHRAAIQSTMSVHMAVSVPTGTHDLTKAFSCARSGECGASIRRCE